MSSEFVLGYIQAIDGERDPRNLLTVFHSVYLIIGHLDFGECFMLPLAINQVKRLIFLNTDTLAEDLFDVTSCYFPIDFNPVMCAAIPSILYCTYIHTHTYPHTHTHTYMYTHTTQPANDPLAVTKESLVLSLRKCLTATDKFAEVSETTPSDLSSPVCTLNSWPRPLTVLFAAAVG